MDGWFNSPLPIRKTLVVPGLLGHFEGELVQVFLGLVQAVADIQLVAKNSEQSPFGGSSAPVVVVYIYIYTHTNT